MAFCWCLWCYQMPDTDSCSCRPLANNMLMACPWKLYLVSLSSLSRPILIEYIDLIMLALDVVHDEQVAYFGKNAAPAALLLGRTGNSGRERNLLAL